MLITIRHALTIDFKQPLPRLLLHLLLTPQTGPNQKVLDWSLAIDGAANTVQMIDGFGNNAVFASLTGVDAPVAITLTGTVETLDGNGVLGWPQGEPVPWLFQRVTPATRVPASVWSKFRAEADQPDTRLGALHGLMARVHTMHTESVERDAVAEQGQAQNAQGDVGTQFQTQNTENTDTRAAQEQVETFVGAARALGIPARFVSGYLAAGQDDDEIGPHAWAEAFVDGLGWIGFDTKLDLCPTDRHIRMATGLDAMTAAPIRAYPPVGDDIIPVQTRQIDIAAGTAQ